MFFSKHKVCLVVGHPGNGVTFLPSVADEVKKAYKLAKDFGFKEITVLENSLASKDEIELYLADQTSNCIKHKR